METNLIAETLIIGFGDSFSADTVALRKLSVSSGVRACANLLPHHKARPAKKGDTVNCKQKLLILQ